MTPLFPLSCISRISWSLPTPAFVLRTSPSLHPSSLILHPCLLLLLLLSLAPVFAAAPTNATSISSLTVLRDPKALATLMDTLDDTKKLGAGDKVTFRVLEDQDETKPLTVSDAGDLDVPYYGLVQADKKTCKQLALEIKTMLEKRDYRRATVIISLQEINRKRILGKVYVVGQVRQSGPVEIPDDEEFTVSKVILRAGGFSDFADKHKVKLIRGGARVADSSNTTLVDVSEIWERGKTSNDVPVQAGDVVFVAKRNINF